MRLQKRHSKSPFPSKFRGKVSPTLFENKKKTVKKCEYWKQCFSVHILGSNPRNR